MIVSNAFKYLQREGLQPFLVRAAQELSHRAYTAKSYARRYVTGRFVEFCGNTWTLDDCTFSFDSPAIATEYKNRFVSGKYEDKERRLVRKYVDPSLPVIEGGGCLGVVSCVTNKLLRDPTKHVVVEAHPDLWEVLEANRNRNGCGFEIIRGAFDQSGTSVTFHIHKLFVGGSVQRKTERSVTVPAVTVRSLLQKTGWDRVNLVLDIEGAEIDLFEKEADAIRDHVAVIIVEMHPVISGEQAVARALQTVERLGFVFKERQEDVYVYAKLLP